MYRPSQQRRLSEWLTQRSRSERETLARLWALSPPSGAGWDAQTLADAMLQPASVQRVLDKLDERARRALDQTLAEKGAEIPAVVLEREWGTVRSHDSYPNPRAYLLALEQPPSATEKLFTMGLILPINRQGGRFYLVPEDLRPLLPAVPPRDRSIRLRPEEAEPAHPVDADLFGLERNVVTLLALGQRGELQVAPGRGLNKASLLRIAKRWGQERDDLRGLTYEKHWRYLHFLRSVLEAAGLLRTNTAQEMRPTSDALAWLSLPRVERLQRLLQGWVETPWDELEHFCGITIKGYAFGRDLAATRLEILDMLRQAPADRWIGWETLFHEVQEANPDFMRRDGRYDNWRLVNYRNEHLDGFEHWRDVEGAVLQAAIGTSLRWLGLIDWGGSDAGEESVSTSFRLSAYGAAALGIAPAPEEAANEPLFVQGTFEIVVRPRVAPVGRFWAMCAARWNASDEVERYTLTKASVQEAVAAGADADMVRQVLEETSGNELPPNVAYSLREWSGQLGQLTLERGVILRAVDPVLLEQVRRDKRVRMPPYEQLTPDKLLLDDGDAATLAERLRKAGYGLRDEDGAEGGSLSDRDMTILYGALEFYAAACNILGIDGEASDALRRRVMRRLDQRQRQQALQVRSEALRVLEDGVKGDGRKR